MIEGVCPEGDVSNHWHSMAGISPRCVGLAGGSPATVSAGAPCSRPRAAGEISTSKRGVESPTGAVWCLGGKQSRGPSMKRTLQPRDIYTRKGGMAEPIMSRRRQQTARMKAGAVQDVPGVLRRARGDSPARNRRGPTWQPTFGKDPFYKPKVKWMGVGRESEGLIVPMRSATRTPSEGRGPTLVALVVGGNCEDMAGFGPTIPRESTITPARAFHSRQASTGKLPPRRVPGFLRGDVLEKAWRRRYPGGAHVA